MIYRGTTTTSIDLMQPTDGHLTQAIHQLGGRARIAAWRLLRLLPEDRWGIGKHDGLINKNSSIRVWHFPTSQSRAKSILGTRICSSIESGSCPGSVTFSPSSRVLQEAGGVARDMFLSRKAWKCSCYKQILVLQTWSTMETLMFNLLNSILQYCILILPMYVNVGSFPAIFHWKYADSFTMDESWKFHSYDFLGFAGVWRFLREFDTFLREFCG